MHLVRSLIRFVLMRVSVLLLLVGLLRRGREAWRRRERAAIKRRHDERATLPSLFDVHPAARVAPRRRVGLVSVPLERIVGTLRSPSQNTADFLPLPRLRGQNWRARWQRIDRAMDRLEIMPPVDLVQVGDDYYVEDGHNRVAAARHAGAAEIDADVTQLLVPGLARPDPGSRIGTTAIGGDALRRAAAGRHSRTVEERYTGDQLSRRDLLRAPGEPHDDGDDEAAR